MTEAPLIETRGRRIVCGDGVVELVWLGETLAIALAGGSVKFAGLGLDTRVAAHDRAILSACAHPDGCSIVTGGDDGFVRRTSSAGGVSDLGQFGRTWIHAVRSSAESGAIIAAVGREAIVWKSGAAAPSHRFAFDSSIGGISLDGRGKKLAVSHYNGATVLYPLMAEAGVRYSNVPDRTLRARWLQMPAM